MSSVNVVPDEDGLARRMSTTARLGESTVPTLSARLAELKSQFSNNVLDATEAYQNLITDPAELAGIPDNLLGMLKQSATQRDLEGYLVTLDAPSYLAVMNHCDNRALRHELYVAYGTRASGSRWFHQATIWLRKAWIAGSSRVSSETRKLGCGRGSAESSSRVKGPRR